MTGTRPQKTAFLVAQRIVADIDREGIGPGGRLPPERVMLEQYGVGRGTLRETLRFLELQGVLEMKPGPSGGPIVQQPDARSLATVLTLGLQFKKAPFLTIAEARVGLEPMMAQLAATRISKDQLELIRVSVETMGNNVSNRAVFLEENKSFHDLIAHGSGNALFGYLIDALLDILDGSAIGIDYPEVRRAAVYEAHLRIYEAVAAHDPNAAYEAMADHIRQYVQYVERKFPEVLAAPIVWGQTN